MSQLRKTTAELEESDANQLRIAKRLESLEEKFDREKREKQNLENELGSFKDQVCYFGICFFDLLTDLLDGKDELPMKHFS